MVRPVIGGYYERAEFPYDLVARMAKLGLFGLPFPAEFGGMDGDLFALGLALEELARVDSSVAITLEAAVALGAMPIYRFGTDEQRRRWLPGLCSGEQAGRVRPDRGGRGLGHPRRDADHGRGWSTGDGGAGDGSGSSTGPSRSSPTPAPPSPRWSRCWPSPGVIPGGPREISSIVVPAGTPGLTVGPEYSKVGWCASDTRELAFASCRVPADHLLGARGRGYAQFLEILDEGRIAIAALAVGLAQGCVDECLRYTGERAAFGHRLGHYQAIRFKLADMEARTHSARLAWYDAAARLVAGEPVKRQAAIAKLHRLQRGDGQRPGGHPDLRRLRVHERVPGRPLLPRRQGARDRRGHL